MEAKHWRKTDSEPSKECRHYKPFSECIICSNKEKPKGKWKAVKTYRISDLEKKLEKLINTEAHMNKIYIDRIEKLEMKSKLDGDSKPENLKELGDRLFFGINDGDSKSDYPLNILYEAMEGKSTPYIPLKDEVKKNIFTDCRGGKYYGKD